MGTNSFISHHLYVAAVRGAAPAAAPARTARQPADRSSWAQQFQAGVSPEQLSAWSAQHWMDFPFARNWEPAAG